MNRSRLAAASATVLIFWGSVDAGPIDDEIVVIKARLKQLEQQLQAQNQVNCEKDLGIEELTTNPQAGKKGKGAWFQSVGIGDTVTAQLAVEF